MSAALQLMSSKAEGSADGAPLDLESGHDASGAYVWIWRPREQVEVTRVVGGMEAFSRSVDAEGNPAGGWRVTQLSEQEDNAAWARLMFESPPEPNGEEM